MLAVPFRQLRDNTATFLLDFDLTLCLSASSKGAGVFGAPFPIEK
jgi:hypothetical protein